MWVVHGGSGAPVEYIHMTSRSSGTLSRRQLKHLCKSIKLQCGEGSSELDTGYIHKTENNLRDAAKKATQAKI